ncbi:MAG: protein-L-isoaspartate(D-aspartate) O-methyltransferase [Candidatus Omnitrophota bacterium]
MTEADFTALRDKMVADQIIKRGICNENVLASLRAVPRHFFVPENQRHLAYEDYPLAISEGQTISQPYIVALMTERLALCAGQRVLEIGTGSGYQAAILASLGARVFSVERIPLLAQSAKVQLTALGYVVEITIGDGTLGWSEHAPYDKIIITAAAPAISPEWLTQLKVGGKIVLPVGGLASQDLMVVTKIDEERIDKEIICGCMFVPLVGKYGFC